MPNKLREYDCEDCGARTRRNRKSNAPMICVECGVKRAVEWNLHQIEVSSARKRDTDALQ